MRNVIASIFVALFCLFISPQVSMGAEINSSSQESTVKQILDNGLTVLIREMPASPVVCVYALVKAGSATEGEYLGSGISHFLEHMLFKGTPEQGVGEIASRIQAAGGSINASTSHDYTIYTIEVPPESFDMALNTLADMVMHSTIDPPEFQKERQVILGEFRLGEDDPGRELSKTAFENIYIKHPYRHPVIGYKELFLDITPEDLRNYYQSQYVPSNMIVSVAGNIHSSEISSKVKKAFEKFPRSKEVTRNLPLEPSQISQRRYEKEYPTDLTRLIMAFSGVSLLDRDLYALDVLSMILGQGNSSPLYRHIYKDKGLVHGISSYNFTPTDRGFFAITAMLEQENLDRTIAAVWEEIKAIQKNLVTKENLEKARRQVLSGYLFGHQTASDIAYAQALDEAFTGDYGFSEKYVAAVKNVTAQDIQRVARQYLNENALTVVALKKPGDKTPGLASAQQQVGEIEKHVLDNGLTVLLREDHTLPIASVRISLQGGTRQEPAELNGISMMTADLLDKGTASRSSYDIAREVESRGMSLGTFSGKNSFGMNIESLSEDLEQAMGLLEDMVKNPVFAPAEITKIKENMKAIIRQRQDNISQTTTLALKETLFGVHPLRRDEAGTLETVEKITRQDILDFYGHLAAPANMVLSVFGDIASKEVLEIVKKKFGSVPKREVQLKQATEEPPSGPRTKEIFMDKTQAMVMFGFHGTDLRNSDRYGLDILAAVLGSPFSGRLFNNIREELGQAYTLGGDSVPSLDAGMIYFYVLTTEEKVAEVKELLSRQITNIQRNLVPEPELENTKMYLNGNFRAGLETNSALSFVSGLDELYGLGYGHYQEYEGAIDRVRAEDIRELARKYLDLNKVVIVTTRPKKN